VKLYKTFWGKLYFQMRREKVYFPKCQTIALTDLIQDEVDMTGRVSVDLSTCTQLTDSLGCIVEGYC